VKEVMVLLGKDFQKSKRKRDKIKAVLDLFLACGAALLSITYFQTLQSFGKAKVQ
jgi:hypothetical protein